MKWNGFVDTEGKLSNNFDKNMEDSNDPMSLATQTIEQSEYIHKQSIYDNSANKLRNTVYFSRENISSKDNTRRRSE